MSVNEDLIVGTSDSFWEVGQFKRTVKRHEDGQKLCNDLMQLIQERADIEKHYAKSLLHWSRKWNDHLDKGSEYGTMLGAWKGVLHEADSMAEIHQTIKTNLLDTVQQDIKNWRTENYKKAMMGPAKETKELEDGFKKAQKPWAKSYAKVLDAKKKYHLACKSEKSVTNQENNARSDSSLSPDQLKKLQDKVEKCRREVETSKEKYEAALADLNSRNAKYMEDMTEAFQKCQEYEEKRLQFFKEQLFGIHKCLDISNNIQIQQIYTDLYHTIDQSNAQQDLRWWSQNHGVDMGMNWPVFEEYAPELNTISRKEKKSGLGGSDGVMLTSIQTKDTYRGDISQPAPIQNTYNNDPAPPASNPTPSYPAAAPAPQRPPLPATPPRKPPRVRQQSYDDSLNPFADDDDDADDEVSDSANEINSPLDTTNASAVFTNKTASTNPFDEDDDEEDWADSQASSEPSNRNSPSNLGSEGSITGPSDKDVNMVNPSGEEEEFHTPSVSANNSS